MGTSVGTIEVEGRSDVACGGRVCVCVVGGWNRSTIKEEDSSESPLLRRSTPYILFFFLPPFFLAFFLAMGECGEKKYVTPP